jgi:hypothetical protein
VANITFYIIPPLRPNDTVEVPSAMNPIFLPGDIKNRIIYPKKTKMPHTPGRSVLISHESSRPFLRAAFVVCKTGPLVVLENTALAVTEVVPAGGGGLFTT